MKNKHIFWGILFISFGIFILVNNLTSYNFYFREVWKVWPAVLILWGLSMIMRQDTIRTVLIGLTAFALAFAVYSSIKTGFHIFDNEFVFNEGDDNWYDKNITINNFTEKYTPQVQKAILNFDAGAGAFIIRDSTTELFQATTEGPADNYKLNRFDEGKESTIDFMMKKKRFGFGHNFKNRVLMKLNSAPEWDLNFNVGASSTELDLTKFKIANAHISMGAASLKAFLGEPLTETNFKVDAGVSSIEIHVPENTGCQIRADVSLSSKDFRGFNKTGDDEYTTDNFSSTAKKIYLDISSGVSSVKVIRDR